MTGEGYINRIAEKYRISLICLKANDGELDSTLLLRRYAVAQKNLSSVAEEFEIGLIDKPDNSNLTSLISKLDELINSKSKDASTAIQLLEKEIEQYNALK